jgi:hypothetical protein
MAAYINPVILMWLFVIFLINAGGRMIYTYWEKSSHEDACPAHYSKGMYALIVVFSFFVGIVSGLLGVGGGILIVPFLIFLCRYPTKNSAGVVSFIVIFSSLFGIFGHMTSGGFDIPLILGCAVAVFVGATIGARSMVKIPSGYIKAGFGVVLWVFAIQLILKLTQSHKFFYVWQFLSPPASHSFAILAPASRPTPCISG